MRRRWSAMLIAIVVVAASCGGAGDGGLATEPGQQAGGGVGPTPIAAPTTPPAEPTTEPGAEPTAAPEDGATPTPLATAEPEVTPTLEPPPEPAETIVVRYREDSFGFQSEFTYTQARDGSFRLERDGDIEVYDATGTARSSSFVIDDEVSVFQDIGVGLGPPDFYGLSFAVQGRAGLNAMARDGSAFAGVGEAFGRETVVFETPLRPNAIGGGPDFETMAVDRETGVMLSYLGTESGRPTVTLEALSVETFPTKLDVFALDPALVDGATGFDSGFIAVSGLGEASELVGYPVLTPAVVPSGYEISAVRVAPGTTDGFTGAEASNPQNVDVVNVRYSNGWRHFTVSTRRADDTTGFGWIDPMSGEGQIYDLAPFTLEGGALAGAAAEVTSSPETLPHLWAQTSDIIFTVAGPLTEFEMIDIAESLVAG